MPFRRGKELLDVFIRHIIRNDDALKRTVSPDAARNGPRVHISKDRNMVLFKEGKDRSFVAPRTRFIAEFINDKPFIAAAIPLIKNGIAAIVADERIGKDYNLSAERRVRQGFLIAAHACCEDDFTNSRMVPIKGSFIDTTIF